MRTKRTDYKHVRLWPDGTPTVGGTRLKVKHLAALHRNAGRTAEALYDAYPDHTLGEIYSALAYYYDHRDEIDREIERGRQEVERIRAEIEAEHGGSRVLTKLNTSGRRM